MDWKLNGVKYFGKEPLVKKVLVVLICSLLSFNLSLASDGEPNPKLVQVGASDVIIPADLNSTSEIYVIVSGFFPNGCYGWNHADVTHKDKMTHEIRIIAAVVEGPCKMVLVPFLQPVAMGQFEIGQHNLRFLNQEGNYTEKTLSIEQF